jgi:hypothetical protein
MGGPVSAWLTLAALASLSTVVPPWVTILFIESKNSDEVQLAGDGSWRSSFQISPSASETYAERASRPPPAG